MILMKFNKTETGGRGSIVIHLLSKKYCISLYYLQRSDKLVKFYSFLTVEIYPKM